MPLKSTILLLVLATAMLALDIALALAQTDARPIAPQRAKQKAFGPYLSGAIVYGPALPAPPAAPVSTPTVTSPPAAPPEKK